MRSAIQRVVRLLCCRAARYEHHRTSRKRASESERASYTILEFIERSTIRPNELVLSPQLLRPFLPTTFASSTTTKLPRDLFNALVCSFVPYRHLSFSLYVHAVHVAPIFMYISIYMYVLSISSPQPPFTHYPVSASAAAEAHRPNWIFNRCALAGK